MDKNCGPHFCLLPFMVEEESPLGKSFFELLRTIQHGQTKLVWKKIEYMLNSDLGKPESLMYQIRMFVSTSLQCTRPFF